MNDKIINKVANADLITIDLSDYCPKKNISVFDIKDFLFKGVILKEREFRRSLKEFDFSFFSGKIVALKCSSDAIVPMWSYMLITSLLNNVSAEVYFGDKEEVFQNLFLKNIETLDSSEFINKKIIIKGCSDIPLSESLYVTIVKKLQSNVNSLMFGEACSAVPVFKKR